MNIPSDLYKALVRKDEEAVRRLPDNALNVMAGLSANADAAAVGSLVASAYYGRDASIQTTVSALWLSMRLHLDFWLLHKEVVRRIGVRAELTRLAKQLDETRAEVINGRGSFRDYQNLISKFATCSGELAVTINADGAERIKRYQQEHDRLLVIHLMQAMDQLDFEIRHNGVNRFADYNSTISEAVEVLRKISPDYAHGYEADLARHMQAYDELFKRHHGL